MSRYFFDVRDGVDVPDVNGHECANLDAARRLAARFAGELLQGAPDRLWRDGDWTISVRDERGLHLFLITIVATLAPAVRDVVWSAIATPD